MKIAISMESTCDLPKELIEKYNFEIIPYSVILGDNVVTDEEGLSAKIFEYVEKTKVLPKTSAINEMQYKEYFTSLLEKYDTIIHITLSSGLTSSVAHAETVVSKMKNVYVIDSKTLSTGISLLGIYARELADAGEAPETIVEKVTARVPYVQASFVVERLDYLYKGGRCNSLAYFGANLLKIRPQIVVTEEGKMKSGKKYRGKMGKVIESYCADTLAEFNNADKKIGFITYTTATEEMVASAMTAMQNAGFETIYETRAGGTITSHCGEHVLGILYLNDGDKIQ